MTTTNEIAAIQTTYKGYRFRSRLEARWAIFFDLSGMRWEYEVEPIKVNGEAYLPDFKLYPYEYGQPVYMEIKPYLNGSPIMWPRVYLAGKCSVENEWRGGAAEERNNHHADWRYAEFFTTMGGASFLKCGPFPGDSHGCRDETPHGLDEKKSVIVGQCQLAITRASIFCAHISTLDAFGTLVELGMAQGRNNPVLPISLTITENVITQCSFDDLRHCLEMGTHDLWFLEHLINASPGCVTQIVRDSEEARAFHGSFIRGKIPREIRLACGIAAAGNPVVMVFGDPLSVGTLDGGDWLSWRFDIAKFIKNNPRHAEAARSHRFDRR